MVSSTSEMHHVLQAPWIRATTGEPFTGLPCVMRSVSLQALRMSEPSDTDVLLSGGSIRPVPTYSRLFKGAYDSINITRPASLTTARVHG